MFLIALFSAAFSLSPFALADESVDSNTALKVTSTIAGFDTYYSFTGSDKDMILGLVTPEGKKHKLGKAETKGKIDGRYLKDSGKYKLLAVKPTASSLLKKKYEVYDQISFKVLADETSSNRSKIEFLSKPSFGQEVPLVVTLRDKYGNPVSNHEVQVFADTGTVTSQVASSTNEEGKVIFKYKKLDQNADKVMAFDRTEKVPVSNMEISKFAAASVYGFGGDLVSLAPGERFDFTDVPDSVEPLEPFSFTLVALDESQEVDPGYLGEVRFFTETDDNAELPSDYTFEVADAGEHTFTNATSFSTEGEHVLQVVDVDDDSLIGELTVNVEFAGLDGDDSDEGAMQVDSPVSGTSNTNIINFSGSTDPGVEVRVFDNGEILDADDADINGNFNFNSPVLPDGEHRFVLETDFATSNEIVVNIDTTGDLVSNILVDPTTVSGTGLVNVEVSLTEEAERVSVILNERRTDLTRSDSQGLSFAGQVNAPADPGAYNLSLIVDTFEGQSVTVTDIETVTVSGSGSGGITFNVPSQVVGVQATPGDRRVTLNWQASQDNTGIDHYRINYGIDPNLLLSTVDTNTNDTSWFIPNLINGTTYYFQIYGIDTEGNLGDQASQVVFATPSSEFASTMHGSGDGQVLVNQTADTGPEIYVLLVFAAFFAYKLRLTKQEI